jgi:hypothetical protein
MVPAVTVEDSGQLGPEGAKLVPELVFAVFAMEKGVIRGLTA